MGKLIATDLDGTLLPEGTFHLNPEYYEVIRRLHDEGHVFVAASGRHYSSMRKLLEPVWEDVIFLCGNGTYVACRGVSMAVRPLPDRLYEEIIPEMKKNGIFTCADTPDAMWTDSDSEMFQRRLSGGYRVNLKRIDDLRQLRDVNAKPSADGLHDRGVLKCAMYTEKDAAPMAERFKQRFGSQAHIMTAGERWVDCVPLGVDKGTALSQIQQKLGFSQEDTVAFGDNGNDVGMLNCAGESYCVEGGREEVKKAAKHVIGSMEDDAVLDVLKRFLA